MPGVPMLTVTHGRRATRVHILVYTVLLAVLARGHGVHRPSAARSIWPQPGAERAVPAKARATSGAATRRSCEADNYKVEKKFFQLSLLYLFAAFRRDPGRGGAAPLSVWEAGT